ncbi:uncharacterized protein [Physcomitrium patens]
MLGMLIGDERAGGGVFLNEDKTDMSPVIDPLPPCSSSISSAFAYMNDFAGDVTMNFVERYDAEPRPVEAAAKTGGHTSRLLGREGDRERTTSTATKIKASKLHSIDMQSLRPATPTSPQVFRTKQVRDPWPENVRARLVGSDKDMGKVNYSSSGSEHGPSSNCLAAMVYEFMEKEEIGKCGRARCNCESGCCNGDGHACLEDEIAKASLGNELSEALQNLVPCDNEQERSLLGEVIYMLDALTGDTITDGKGEKEDCASNVCRRRSVVKYLRSSGYNAALCKSRWDHAGIFPGGDYEYIDVVFTGLDESAARVIVDIDFQDQFEIARPTAQYKNVYQMLPAVFVGTANRLLQILNVISEAVKRSLKKKGMFLPPWRKPEYVKAKWFASYKRTTNESSRRKQIKDSACSGILTNISLVAERSTERDKKFTNETEREVKVESVLVSREAQSALEAPKTANQSVHKAEAAQPEGFVHGANRLKHLWSDVKTDIPREIQDLDNTDWQPPALLPRASNARSASTGLTSVLREAGLIGNKRKSNLGSIQEFTSPVAVM